ncbi:unnamed protein product [Gulo gulo]|uniref:Uncharacterized protein n=1 Tax=Gulo gulo TaxID=48420 RepID=A0A9X9LI79_GULGU|nr:unnamed protein product [Gulo gulo]
MASDICQASRKRKSHSPADVPSVLWIRNECPVFQRLLILHLNTMEKQMEVEIELLLTVVPCYGLWRYDN